MVTIRKTIEIAMLALCACGPTTPAGGVRAAGGVDPIVCYRSALHVCRDGVGSFWQAAYGETPEQTAAARR